MSLLIKKPSPSFPPQPKEEKAEKEILKPQTKADKTKAVVDVMKALNKEYGSLVIQKFKSTGRRIPSLPLRMPTFDEYLMSCGGVPDGRVIEIYGPESAGKTTIALDIIAEAQKHGDICAFVDAEHALDPSYAAKLGVDIDELLISQPDNGEQAIEVVLALVDSGAVRVIVVDSVSALVPQAELDGDVGDSHMGLQARLMSQTMRKLVGRASKAGTTVIFINQVREKIGVMFGNPEVTTGGRALKFYASVRLEVRRVAKSDGGEIKEGETHVGHWMRIKNMKNKVGPPFRETKVALLYASGLDKRADVIEWAILTGIVIVGDGTKEKEGNGVPKTWFGYGGQNYRKNDLTGSPIFETISLAAYAARDARLKAEADEAAKSIE